MEFPDYRPAYSRVAPTRSRPLFAKQIFQLNDPKIHQWFKANEQRVVSDVSMRAFSWFPGTTRHSRVPWRKNESSLS